MTRRITSILLVFFLLAPAYAMGSKPSQSTTSATLRYGVKMELKIATDKDEYKAGEAVKIKLSLENVGKKDYSADFSSGQSFDIRVFNEKGEEVWSWGKGRVFTQALRPFKLTPGRKEEWGAVWRQTDNAQKPVPPGRYFIAGEIVLIPRMYTQRKEIQIKGPGP